MFDWLDRVIEWADKHPGLAGWMQGVGALLAVAIAIYVPYIQRKNETKNREQDRLLRARSLAVGLFPQLIEVKAQLPHIDALSTRMINAPSILHADLPKLRIFDLSYLAERLDDLYLFGSDLGAGLQQLYAMIQQHNRISDRIKSMFQTGTATHQDLERHLSNLGTYRQRVTELLSEAMDKIDTYHDGIASE